MKNITSLIILLLTNSAVLASTDCNGELFDLSEISKGSEARFKSRLAKSENIIVYRRTEYDLKVLTKQGRYLKEHEPNKYITNNKTQNNWPSFLLASKKHWASSNLRSTSKEFFVAWEKTPYLKCKPIHKPRQFKDTKEVKHILIGSWPGGFFDPCYGGGYDYSGRQILELKFLNNPELKKLAVYNLVVPNYFISNDKLCLQIET